MEAALPIEAVAARPSFEEWVDARGAALLRFAYLVTGDRDHAEDAVQDALASACAKWSRVSGSHDPEAYVRRMIVNAHVSWWRRFRRRETPVADVAPAPETDTAGPERDDDVAAVWALCMALPRRQRAAVVLRYYEGLSYAEIAAVLDCSQATVRSQVHRALASLRERLIEEEADVDG